MNHCDLKFQTSKFKIEAPCTKCAGMLPHHAAGNLPCKENGWLCQLKKSFHTEAAVYYCNSSADPDEDGTYGPRSNLRGMRSLSIF